MSAGKLLLGAVGIIAIFGIYNNFSGSTDASNSSLAPHGGTNATPTQNTNTRTFKDSNLAPDFNLTRLDGGMINLASYRGDKPVVLDFWASWCHNCQRDMPILNGYYEKYKDQVEVIGVNLRESNSAASRFVDARNITFPIAMDPSGTTSRNYNIRYTNTHVLIKKDGTIFKTVPGDIRESDITTLINAS